MGGGGFYLMINRSRRRKAYKKHTAELTSRYAVQCITDTWNVELRLSPLKLPPVICLLTEESLVVFNLKTEQEDVYSLKQFLWGTHYHKSPLDEYKGLVLHFEQNQQLKTIHLRMPKRTHAKFLECFQKIANTTIHRGGFPTGDHRAVMAVEQDIHGVWQLGIQGKLVPMLGQFMELVGDDDTIIRVFSGQDIHKVDVIKSTHVEINGTLPKGFNGIVRLHLPDETICYAMKSYWRFGLDLSGALRIPYENIDHKHKKNN